MDRYGPGRHSSWGAWPLIPAFQPARRLSRSGNTLVDGPLASLLRTPSVLCSVCSALLFATAWLLLWASGALKQAYGPVGRRGVRSFSEILPGRISKTISMKISVVSLSTDDEPVRNVPLGVLASLAKLEREKISQPMKGESDPIDAPDSARMTGSNQPEHMATEIKLCGASARIVNRLGREGDDPHAILVRLEPGTITNRHRVSREWL